MITLRANIHLTPENEGGQSVDGFSGMQPSISVSGDLIASKILRQGNNTIERGIDHAVIIQLPYGEHYGSDIHSGMKFTINIGGMVIGRGVVVEVDPPHES